MNYKNTISTTSGESLKITAYKSLRIAADKLCKIEAERLLDTENDESRKTPAQFNRSNDRTFRCFGLSAYDRPHASSDLYK